MEELIIDKSHYLGEGRERIVYIHPNDDGKVIKVTKQDRVSKNNALDGYYAEFLEKSGRDLSHITKCYGWIKTSEGEGLVFERVRNFDSSDAITFETAIKDKLIDQEQQKDLLEELRIYLVKNGILFDDVSLVNLVLKKESEHKLSLIIIDGLGERKHGWKFFLRRHIKFFALFKIQKRWKRLMGIYNDLVAA